MPAHIDEGFSVEPGFRPEHRQIVAEGYLAAFARKLRYPLGPEPQAVSFLGRVLNPACAVSAVSPNGSFMGIAGFKTPEGAFVGGDLREMAKVYGWFGGIARGLLAGVLERKCKAEVLLMDGIFVQPDARGLGVGSALLDAIEQRAMTSGLREVRLDVIDENPRARALYERRGFEARAQVSLAILKPVFGFRSVRSMIKVVR